MLCLRVVLSNEGSLGLELISHHGCPSIVLSDPENFLHWQWVPSPAVGQAAACAPVTQRARVRSPVGTGFLGEVFSGFSSPVRRMSGSFRPPRSPNIIWPSFSSSLIIHYGRQLPEMLTRPKILNIHTCNGSHERAG